MADLNYFNPQAVNPGTNFKPDGFLGGYIWGQDRNRYEALAPLQDFMAQMSAMEQMNKMKEYGLNEQVRATGREAEIAKNRTTASTYGREKEADVSGKELKNKYESGTLESRMADTIAEHAAKAGPRGLAMIAQAAAVASILGQAAGSGPLALEAIQEKLREMKIDPNDPVVKWIASGKNPQEIQQNARLIENAANQADPIYRRTMDQERLKGENSMAVAKEHTRGTLGAAQIRANASVKGGVDGFAEAMKKGNMVGIISNGDYLLNSPDVPEAMKAKIRPIVEQAKKMWAEQQARGQGAVIDPTLAPQGGGAIHGRAFGETPQGSAPGPVIDFNTLK